MRGGGRGGERHEGDTNTATNTCFSPLLPTWSRSCRTCYCPPGAALLQPVWSRYCRTCYSLGPPLKHDVELAELPHLLLQPATAPCLEAT